MRANKLFVITIGFDTSQELLLGAKSLYDRLVITKRATTGEVALVKVLSISETTGVNWKVISGESALKNLDSDEDLGVYLIAHHGREIRDLGGATAKEVALTLSAIGFKHIRKLCLVACNLDLVDGVGEALSKEFNNKATYDRFKDDPNKKKLAALRLQQSIDAQQAAQSSFIGSLAKELAQKGMKPMIAGWDTFITVCFPNHPVLKTSPGIKMADNDTGRKIIMERGQNKPYIYANPQGPDEAKPDSPRHKVVVRWIGESGTGVVATVADGWSDKNRLVNL
ncbi:MAG TPA: hypothetical protein VNY32_08750 [Candidatus Acidoferrales bacterium]|jgi:hypothetical protein|nr:hypothetical protein [Candidatus Acidoferrales bacterium]